MIYKVKYLIIARSCAITKMKPVHNIFRYFATFFASGNIKIICVAFIVCCPPRTVMSMVESFKIQWHEVSFFAHVPWQIKILPKGIILVLVIRKVQIPFFIYIILLIPLNDVRKIEYKIIILLAIELIENFKRNQILRVYLQLSI